MTLDEESFANATCTDMVRLIPFQLRRNPSIFIDETGKKGSPKGARVECDLLMPLWNIDSKIIRSLNTDYTEMDIQTETTGIII